jgi:hypothetical protein
MSYKKFLGAMSTALMIVIVILALAPGVWAQSKYKTLYKFKGGTDQAPGNLIFDAAGNLYGTSGGGTYGGGAVLELRPSSDGSWTESVLYSFCSLTNCVDGQGPNGPLIFDQAGNLYGTTYSGGTGVNGGLGGTVFKLTPNSDGSWTESVLYSFCVAGWPCNDGLAPEAGLIFDQAGNLYGTTSGQLDCYSDGEGGCGNVFKLTPNSDGSWTESVLYTFCSLTNCTDGEYPEEPLVFDQAGNLYSTAIAGGTVSCELEGCGVVFKLEPNSDGSWTETVLHSFCSLKDCRDGGRFPSNLIIDQAGNLYGATAEGGIYSPYGGVAFKLTQGTDGSWSEKPLYQFGSGKDGAYIVTPGGFQAGSLYGVTWSGGNPTCGCGVVFKLTPGPNGGWHETRPWTFSGHPAANPTSVILDTAGNIYGTVGGGPGGSVFEITP